MGHVNGDAASSPEAETTKRAPSTEQLEACSALLQQVQIIVGKSRQTRLAAAESVLSKVNAGVVPVSQFTSELRRLFEPHIIDQARTLYIHPIPYARSCSAARLYF